MQALKPYDDKSKVVFTVKSYGHGSYFKKEDPAK
jgi:hypothetical protein